MAQQEAILIVIDVSESMGKNYSQNRDRISLAVQAAKMMLQQKVIEWCLRVNQIIQLQFHKTHEVGLILFGVTDGTANVQFPTVSTPRLLGRCQLDFLRMIEEGIIKPHNKGKGDWVAALQMAADQISQRIGTKKYKKRVFLITDGENKTSISNAAIRDLVAQFCENQIKLNAITIDFCPDIDDDDDVEDDDQVQAAKKLAQQNAGLTDTQIQNQRLLRKFVGDVQGRIFPADMAINIYKQFQKRSIYPVAKYKGWFNLSDKAKFSVKVYGKVSEQKLPSLKKFSLIADPIVDINQGGVSMDRSYYLADDPDMNPIPQDQRVKGYMYGKQLVPVPEQNQQLLKFKCDRSFKLLGFASKDQVPHHIFKSGVDIVMPIAECPSHRAFSAFVHATMQKNSVAICRFVYQNGRSPQLVALTPKITQRYECFYLNYLPTLQDMRDYQFPNVNPATNKQLKAADCFINSLDLMKGSVDQDGDFSESLNIKQTFNPVLQHFTDCANHRVFNPEDKNLPDVNPEISSYLRPDRGMFERAGADIKKFVKSFDLRVREQEEIKNNKKRGRICWKDMLDEGLDQQDVMVQAAMRKQQALGQAIANKAQKIEPDFIPVKKISSVTPVDDFMKMIDDKKQDLVEDAMRQLGDVIDTYLQAMVMGDLIPKALQCIQALRDGAVREDQANTFNDYLYNLRDKQAVDQNVRQFMKQVREAGITVITRNESTSSNLLKRDADDFLKEEVELIKKKPEVQGDDELMDLID